MKSYRVLHFPSSIARIIYDGEEKIANNIFHRTKGFGMFQLWSSNEDGKFGERYDENVDHLIAERHGPVVHEIDGIEFTTLIFSYRETLYLAGEGETSDVHPGPVSITDINLDWGSGKFFLFYVADCAFPPMFIVRHDSFEDAYEEFIDWQADQIKIEESDLKNYERNGQLECSFTSNGTPVDTESVQGHEVKLVACIDMRVNGAKGSVFKFGVQ